MTKPYPKPTDRPDFKVWTVYDHPTDHPDLYVARLFIGIEPTETALLDADLERLRERLAKLGLVRLDRHPDDDATIMECWI